MAPALPVVRVVGAGRNVGKTWLASRLIAEFTARSYRVVSVKRSHHPVTPDRPGADTDLFARAGSVAVVFGASDGTLVRSPAAATLEQLVAPFSGSADLVIVEGFKGDSLGARVEVSAGEPPRARVLTMDGECRLETVTPDVCGITQALECMFRLSSAGDASLREALRRAAALHGHRCAGLTLGARMALTGARALGVSLPDAARELCVELETARCATDAFAAVSGCTAGTGALRVREQGKLAATLTHVPSGRSVRVAARSGLREVAARTACACRDAGHGQEMAYRTLPPEDLFSVSPAAPLCPSPRAHRRELCADCGEETDRAYLVPTPAGTRCLACAGAERT